MPDPSGGVLSLAYAAAHPQGKLPFEELDPKSSNTGKTGGKSGEAHQDAMRHQNEFKNRKRR